MAYRRYRSRGRRRRGYSTAGSFVRRRSRSRSRRLSRSYRVSRGGIRL